MKDVGRGGRYSHERCETACVFWIRAFDHFGYPTAYEIAKSSGFTPQHVNRTLVKLFAKGMVGYKVEKSRNGEKRQWCYAPSHFLEDGWEMPSAVQLVMFAEGK